MLVDRLNLLASKKSNDFVNKSWLLKSNVRSNKLNFVVKKLRNSNNCKKKLLKKLC